MSAASFLKPSFDIALAASAGATSVGVVMVATSKDKKKNDTFFLSSFLSGCRTRYIGRLFMTYSRPPGLIVALRRLGFVRRRHVRQSTDVVYCYCRGPPPLPRPRRHGCRPKRASSMAMASVAMSPHPQLVCSSSLVATFSASLLLRWL